MLNTRGLLHSALALAAVFTIAAAPANDNAARFHVHLVRSEPSPNDTLAKPPSALRFWFSEKVELPVTTVRLVTDAGNKVALAPLTRRDTASAPVIASVAKPLAPGHYHVIWSTTSTDGHAAKGSFTFRVKAPR